LLPYSFFLLSPPPPSSPLFPYTTLFRSRRILLQLALQAAPVDAEPARRLGDVPAGVREHAVDVFPLRARQRRRLVVVGVRRLQGDRKSTRLNSSHLGISYAVFCLKKKKT